MAVPDPFAQLRYDDLPDQPRVAHRWAEVRAHRGAVPSDAFGPLDTAWYTFGDPDAEPLLLVHGLMTHAYTWRYALAPLGARYHLVMPDLPGAGATAKPVARYHPDRMADWIAAFASHVGIRGARTIGNSLGGYLCLRAALRDPGALGPLCDLHGPAVPLPRLWALFAAMRVPGADTLLGGLVGWDPERWCHRNTHYWDETLKSKEEAQTWARPLREPGGVAAFAAHLRDTLDPRELRAFARSLAERRDRGEPFPVPLLLVYARRDPMVPPAVGEALAALIPSATLRWLDEASHFAHVDAVDRFVACVTPFFARPSPPPAG